MVIRLKKVALGFLVAVLALVIVVGLMVAQYMGYFHKNVLDSAEPVFLSGTGGESLASATQAAQPASAETYRVEAVASGLEVPWSIVFTSPTRLLVSERPGRIRRIEDGKLIAEPVMRIPEVSSIAEEGVMGMALDPAYSENKALYVCYAYGKPGSQKDRVVRLIDAGDRLTSQTTILDDIPAAQFHAGCELGFGPDGKLYITTGDATNKNSAQDLSSLGGKILRINADGSYPSDNPFPNSPVWSYGHRNPQGLDWLGSGDSAVLFEAEHGPSGIDGAGGGDEINIIKKGDNYGWPLVSHEKTKAGMVDPKLVFTPAVAPSSLLVYEGSLLPQFAGNVFFSMLRGTGITRVVLDADNPEKIRFFERLPGIEFGRIRDIVAGPDGAIYFTSSNRDGLGTVKDGDDHVYRIVPASN